MRAAASIATLAPRVAASLVADRVRGRVTPGRVPGQPEQLTDAWLTDALCGGVPGAHVVAHALGPAEHGTTSRRALTVAYDADGTAAGLPTALFVKSTATFGTRMVSASMDMGRLETGFYRDLRPGLPIEAPRAAALAHDPRSHRLLVVLEDVTVTRGARFGSVTDPPLDRTGAEALVDSLADLHTAGPPSGAGWLPDAATWLRRADRAIDVRGRCTSGLRRAAGALPPAVRTARDLPELLLHSLVDQGGWVLRHGDVHPGNWYRTRDGAPGLADWQCVTRGAAAHDLAYALAACLSIQRRRAWEVDLVARHADRLAEAGAATGRDPFADYRAATLHGLFMWLATVGRFPGQPRLQPDAVTFATLARLGQAVEDLGTIALLRR